MREKVKGKLAGQVESAELESKDFAAKVKAVLTEEMNKPPAPVEAKKQAPAPATKKRKEDGISSSSSTSSSSEGSSTGEEDGEDEEEEEERPKPQPKKAKPSPAVKEPGAPPDPKLVLLKEMARAMGFWPGIMRGLAEMSDKKKVRWSVGAPLTTHS
jgi:hypothetical protein